MIAMTEELTSKDVPHRISLKLALTPRHSSLLLEIKERLKASSLSDALRKFLELRSKGLLVGINREIHREVENLLTLPLVKQVIEGESFDDFVRWSFDQVVPILFDLIGTIEDPQVRLALTKEQLEVASQLWRCTVLPEHANGVSVHELAAMMNGCVSDIQVVLQDLEMLGLVEKVKVVAGGEVTWRVILNR